MRQDTSYKNINTLPSQETKKFFPKIKTLIFILEISMVLVLLVVWFSSESLQKSKSLWVLFFYSIPSEFLIAVVPHEPVILYFGKYHSPITVALVAVIGTLIAETLNYSAFTFITNTRVFKEIHHRKIVKKIIELFNKAPFVALLVVGFSPVPFYPLRFLVVIARYPLIKYIFAVFLSRTPRFFILALIGYMIKIPDYLLFAFFLVLGVLLGLPLIRNALKEKKN